MRGPDLVARVRSMRPLVADLARALSLSANIDVALVRGMRTALFGLADVTTEMDLWSSALVQTRSGTELSLRGDVLAVFWQELAERPAELERCWLALESLRPAGRPLRRLEEQLTRLAIEGDRAAINASLSSVVNAMLESSERRRDLAAWSARALARLPVLVRECETARVLGSAAAGWVATPQGLAQLTPLPENARLAYRLRADDRRIQLAIGRRGNTLQVAHDLPEPKVTIAVPAASPQLIIDENATYAISLRGVTHIPVARPEVMIGTSDGRRYLLIPERPRPNLAAIAQIFGEGPAGMAYLVAPDLAVSSAHQLRGSSYHLAFGSLRVSARVLSLDLDADIALLELEAPLSVPPLELRANVHQGEVWLALEAGSRDSPELAPGSPVPRLRSGTVASAWPQVTLRLAEDSLESAGPEPLQPGTPIFAGNEVIAHVRGSDPSSAVLHTTSARLIEWWLEQQSRQRVRAPDAPGPHPGGPPRVWSVVRAVSVPPAVLELASHPAMAGDFVLLFAGEPGQEWPAGLYHAGPQKYPPPRGASDWSLLVALPRPHEAEMQELRPKIEAFVQAPEGRDTRSLKLHHELIELVARIGPSEEYDQNQLFRCLDAPRGGEDARRHIPVLLQLPARISSAGLLGAELARGGRIQHFRQHRWGRHPIEIFTEGKLPHELGSMLHVRVGVTAAESAGAELNVAFGHARASRRFARACQQALVEFPSSTSRYLEVSGTGFDLEIDVQCLPGMSPGYACRRGITFLLEVLAALDTSGPARALYFHLPGIGRSDLGEVQANADARHPGVTFVWIDPETDVVRAHLEEGQAESLAYGAVSESAGRHSELGPGSPVQYERDPEDPVSSRFGLSPTRNGRLLLATEHEDVIRVSARSLDERPILGYVTFYFSVATRIDRQTHSARVRASDGAAYCELPRWDEDRAVGAIIEDEGVVLEARVPGTRRHGRLAGERGIPA